MAAAAVTPLIPEREAIVFEAVRHAGSAGAILDELVEATGLEKVTVSPRLKPLLRKGLVAMAGTRVGKAHKPQTVWVAR